MVHAARLTNFADRFIHKTGLLKKKILIYLETNVVIFCVVF